MQSSKLGVELINIVVLYLPMHCRWFVEHIGLILLLPQYGCWATTTCRASLRSERSGMAKELKKRCETLPGRPKFESLASKDKERYENVLLEGINTLGS